MKQVYMGEATDFDRSKFTIEINDEVVLSRDSLVEHVEFGPMRVDTVSVGPFNKTAQLQAETSSIGLELTGDELRDKWGEEIASDPFELHDPGSARYENRGITVEGLDVEVTIKSSGPEKDAERVHMHAIEQTVRALQAMRDGVPPEECEGANYEIDWETVFDGGDDGD